MVLDVEAVAARDTAVGVQHALGVGRPDVDPAAMVYDRPLVTTPDCSGTAAESG
ncbi:hypothetical protein [Streptomyces canus]|uniref:hypothetical protein n=1 Tax=Streptomyces canus TaxID=58343 RepID=UPI00278808FA|nr:hypothetical protein [Streptomyces canus]MDQ0766008.1 hypothetical protein [Streptomyces canus]